MLSKKIHILCAILCFTSAQAKVLLWDLNGVLFDTSRFGVAQSVGVFKFLSYGLFDQQGWSPKPALFGVLNTFGMQQATVTTPLICDPDGTPLPRLMCDWLTGKIKCQDLINDIHQRIDYLDTTSFFVSHREKELVAKTAHAIFDPRTFIRNTHPIRSSVKLLKECASLYDEHGNPHHTLIVLSNWDPESFTLLMERYPDIFSYFDEIFISGDIGVAKPHFACFNGVRDFLATHGLNPNDCYLIDDQKVNIDAAENCGIKGIWVQNTRHLRYQLEAADIL